MEGISLKRYLGREGSPPLTTDLNHCPRHRRAEFDLKTCESCGLSGNEIWELAVCGNAL